SPLTDPRLKAASGPHQPNHKSLRGSGGGNPWTKPFCGHKPAGGKLVTGAWKRLVAVDQRSALRELSPVLLRQGEADVPEQFIRHTCVRCRVGLAHGWRL